MDPDLLSNSSHRFTTRFDNNYNGRYKRKDDLVIELLSGDVTSPCDDRLKGRVSKPLGHLSTGSGSSVLVTLSKNSSGFSFGH